MGPQGPNGVSGYQTVVSNFSGGGGIANCPSGTVVLGGGYFMGSVVPPTDFVIDSGPGSNHEWDVAFHSTTTTPPAESGSVYAICATAN